MPQYATEAVYAALGARVRMIREALGINQAELAKRAMLTRTSLTNIEAGRQRMPVHQIELLATALGVSPKHLLKGIWW